MSQSFKFVKQLNTNMLDKKITAIVWNDKYNKEHKMVFIPPTAFKSAIGQVETFLSEQYRDIETDELLWRYQLLDSKHTINGFSIDSFGEIVLELK